MKRIKGLKVSDDFELSDLPSVAEWYNRDLDELQRMPWDVLRMDAEIAQAAMQARMPYDPGIDGPAPPKRNSPGNFSANWKGPTRSLYVRAGALNRFF